MKKKLLTLLFFAAAASSSLFAQVNRCATAPPCREFETLLAQKIADMRYADPNSTMAVYNIPVIVHVVYNGEALGVGTNISQAQVNSQFDVLNEAYRKLNTDFSTVCPAAFQGVAADCQINFCKALRDPQGNTLAEPGIDRIDRNSKGWTPPTYGQSYIDATIKPNSIWPPNQYFNIWCLYLASPLLGYATFPSMSTLTCLQAPFGTNQTDGIVILYSSFGRVGTVVAPYNLGRTAVHETGHWLGLRHIWGDDTNANGVCGDASEVAGECNGSDCCNDTPNQCDCHYGNVTFPSTDACSPNSPGTMYVNYMDYTNDADMVMFTLNQKTRMQACMANGTYRLPLASSFVCSPSGINDPISQIKFQIFPNPTSGNLTVDAFNMGNDFTVKIYNVIGETVKEMRMENTINFDIDLSDKQNGMYFIELSNTHDKITQKFILSK